MTKFLLAFALAIAPFAARAEMPPATVLAAAKKFGLSVTDARMIFDYTQRGYFINGTLGEMIDGRGFEGPIYNIRSEPGDRDLQQHQYISQLKTALSRLPVWGVPGKALAYRGIYHTSDRKLSDQFSTGRVWMENRFTSSTTSKEVAEGFAKGAFKNEGCGGCDPNVANLDPKNSVLITIVSRTGRDISLVAADGKEKEILFTSGTIFKCTSVKRDEKKRLFVTIEELDPSKMTAADLESLQASDNRSFEKIFAQAFEGLSKPEADAKYQEQLQIWNEQWRKWRAQGLDSAPYPVELLDEENG